MTDWDYIEVEEGGLRVVLFFKYRKRKPKPSTALSPSVSI